MAADLETIVQRMIDANESEDNIAAVIREYRGMGETAAPQSSSSPTPLATVTGGGLATAGRAAVRAGEEIATSPLTGKAVKLAAGPVTQGVSRAAGALVGGMPGYAVGETVAQGMKLPVVRTLAEGAIRSDGEAVAGVGRVLGRAALPIQAAMTAHDIYELMSPESRAAMAAGRERVAAADAASGRRDARDMDRSRRRRMTTEDIAREEINRRKR